MWRHVWIRAFFLTFGLFLAIFSWQFFKFCWTWMRWDKGIYRTSIRFVVLSFTVYLRLSFLWEWTSTVVRTSKKTEILPIFCTAWWVFYCFDDGNFETSSQFIVTFSKLILVSLCGLVDLGHFQFSLWYLRPVLTDCQSFPLGIYHLSRFPQVNGSLLCTDHKRGNNASRHKKLYSGSFFRRKTVFGKRSTLF